MNATTQLQVTKIAALTGHTGSVYTMFNNGSEHLFYSGSGDGMVIQWDLEDTSSGIVTAKVPANIFSLCLIPGNKHLLIGHLQGGIHVIDLSEKKEIKHLAYHQNGVFDIRLDEQQRILTAGGDGMLGVVDSKNFSLIRSVRLSQKSVRQLAFHPSEKILVAGCSDHIAYVLDADNFSVLHQLTPHESTVFSVCFSPDGKYLLTGSRDAQLRIWDAQHGYKLLQTIPAHLYTINCIAYSPDGKLFATASRDKTIKLWDAETFTLLKVIDKEKYNGHVNSVNKLIWMQQHTLVSCSDDRSVLVWKVV